MSEHKYSPGPWTVTESGLSVDAGHTRIRQEAVGPREEREANARLISAAPDLLAAAQNTVDLLQELWSLEDDADCATREEAVRQELQQAIRKAKGADP